jgi:hypothetical protein
LFEQLKAGVLTVNQDLGNHTPVAIDRVGSGAPSSLLNTGSLMACLAREPNACRRSGASMKLILTRMSCLSAFNAVMVSPPVTPMQGNNQRSLAGRGDSQQEGRQCAGQSRLWPGSRLRLAVAQSVCRRRKNCLQTHRRPKPGEGIPRGRKEALANHFPARAPLIACLPNASFKAVGLREYPDSSQKFALGVAFGSVK